MFRYGVFPKWVDTIVSLTIIASSIGAMYYARHCVNKYRTKVDPFDVPNLLAGIGSSLIIFSPYTIFQIFGVTALIFLAYRTWTIVKKLCR